MSFSTRGNPRIASSPVALTSLGAVGGARGTAAGALRIFVEFLTTYDRQAISSLENDLRQVDHAQNTSAKAEEKRQRRLTQVRQSLAEAERVVRGKLNTELRSDLRRIEELEGSRSRNNRQLAVQERAIFNQTAKSLGLTKTELQLLSDRAKLKKAESILTSQQAAAEDGQLARARERAKVEGQISKVQAARSSLAPRLTGLAIGAVGGIVGGAVLGVGFQLAQVAMERVGEAIQDIIDPSIKARAAISNLGEAVVQLARENDLTLLEAATRKAKEFGLELDKDTVALLANFAAQKLANDAIKEYLELIKASAADDALRTQAIKELEQALIAKARAEGTLQNVTAPPERGKPNFTRLLIDGENSLTVATREYDRILAQNTATIDENARARQRLTDATALARIAQDALSNALQAQADIQIAPIDAKIEALGDVGPSARTQALQARLDAASGSSGRGNTSELRNIAEERSLILLRQRLRLLGENINLEKFSGKFLLEAIDAKINALNKQGAAQDRLNRLLDLQFRMSQRIRRQQGESITEFTERRAQEQRHQLTERRDLEREAQQAQLSELRDRVQDEVALAELAERRREALRSQGVSNHQKSLQKQLEASQKADRKALKEKQKALEGEKAAILKKTREAIELASDQATGETLAAIRGAKSIEAISILLGRIAGLQRAKATIEALVEGFAIPSFIAKPFLDNINKALSAYQAKENKLFNTVPTYQGRGGNVHLAEGGVMLLNNSRSPFGSNVKLGEQGTELGVVLSNKVAAALKQNPGGPQQVGPFYVGKSDDWLRDKYDLRQVVQEAVDRAIRS